MNKKVRLFLIIFAVFIYGVIISFSLCSVSVSGSQSGHFAMILNKLMSLMGLPELSEHIVRKLAHFTEHGAFGALLTLIYIDDKTKRRFLVPLHIGFMGAFIDETVQIFTGRGPAIADVWIDFAGVTTAFIGVTIIVEIIRHFRKS